MAEVFRAKYFSIEGFEKIVALKRILPEYCRDEEFLEMFIDEARLTSKLQQANIVQVLDFGKIADTYYLAMEYIDGPNLRNLQKRLLKQGEPFPFPWAAHIVTQVLKALDYASRIKDSKSQPLNIVHRDISPQNVLLSREGEVKITDFGIAKAAHRLSQTQPGKIQGKFGYMSPEQASGTTAVDHRSDLFSLGIIFYELLTGRSLYEAEDTFAKYELVKNARIHPPSHYQPDVPPDYEAIVLKLLQKNPGDRYQNARQVLEALTQAEPKVIFERVAGEISGAVKRLFPEAPLPETPPPEEATARAEAPAEAPPAAAPPEIAAEQAANIDLRSRRRRRRRLAWLALPLLLLAAVYWRAPLLSQLKQTALGRWLPHAEEPAPSPAEPDNPSPAEAIPPSANPAQPPAPPNPEVERIKRLAEAEIERIKAEAEARQKLLDEAQRRQEILETQSEKIRRQREEAEKARQKTAAELATVRAQAARRCPSDMVLISGGPFLFGSPADDADKSFGEPSPNTLDLPPFCIDRFEYPNRRQQLPASGITFLQAQAACGDQNKRLCREEEWEKACKGAAGRRYPYGQRWDPAACATQDGNGVPREKLPSGKAARCQSPSGAFDLSGNLAEFTATVSPRDAARRIVRGGSFQSPGYAARCSSFLEVGLKERYPYLGFRCCRDANVSEVK